MNVQGTFIVRRFWFKFDTPKEVLGTLNNVRWGNPRDYVRAPFVEVNFYSETDRNITFMELKYSEWIDERQDIQYTYTGDDGL